MNYYDQIKNIIIDAETFDKIKDYSKNRNRVNSYYEIGKLLSGAAGAYGENIIGKYAEKLVNETALKRMRKFFNMIQKGATMSNFLNWSIYDE